MALLPRDSDARGPAREPREPRAAILPRRRADACSAGRTAPTFKNCSCCVFLLKEDFSRSFLFPSTSPVRSVSERRCAFPRGEMIVETDLGSGHAAAMRRPVPVRCRLAFLMCRGHATRRRRRHAIPSARHEGETLANTLSLGGEKLDAMRCRISSAGANSARCGGGKARQGLRGGEVPGRKKT